MLAHNVQDTSRTQDVRMPPNVTFDTLLLTPTTLQGLKESGFYKPSPIQLHGIPMGKCGFDLLLEAKSGTGKTAVFSIIALEKLDLSKGLQVVILAPTREIAAQICDVMKQIGSSYQGLKIEVVMGGLPIQEDILRLKKKVHVVVGSPGRLKHLIQEKHVNVSAVRLLVLDEADRLMEKSFQADINYIFSLLPTQKQVIMSSATFPDVTRTFINQYVQNAQHICPDSDSVLLGIEQKFTVVKSNSNIVKQTQHRLVELLRILSSHPFKQCLIFCNYQARVTELHRMLKKEKWPAEQLYGRQEQTDRLEALKTLQEYKCRILISTDLAARGIDASNVDLVINFEPPHEWQTYLHRIGRAGRFGSYGKAVTILSEGKEQSKFKEMLKSIKNSANLSNLWDDEQLNAGCDNDDSITSSELETSSNTPSDKESKSYVNQDDTLSTTLEVRLTEKELAKVEEKMTSILKGCVEAKPPQLLTFSELQTSFAARTTGTGINTAKTDHIIDNEMNNEKISLVLPSEKILETITNTVAKMIELATETTLSKLEPFEDLESDFRTQKELLRDEESLTDQSLAALSSLANSRKAANPKYNENKVTEQELTPKEVTIFTKPKAHKNVTNDAASITAASHNQIYNKEHDIGNKNEDSIDNEYLSSVAQALREAGLPTEFGETKFSKRNQHKSHNSKKNNNQQMNISHTNRNLQNDYRKAAKSTKHSRYDHKTHHMNDNDDFDETCDNGYYSQPQTQRNEQSSYMDDMGKPQSYNAYEYCEDDDTDDQDNQSASYESYRYYINWYNQLKQVTKQMELAFYIDELSKLSD